MNHSVRQMSQWMYGGVWGVLTRWFRVPQEPPKLPIRPGESVEAFRPDRGFLRYMLFKFWLGLLLSNGILFFGWIGVMASEPTWGLISSPLLVALLVVPDVLVYLAIHLRYDATWYVMTDRSLRIRRGIWVIRETTITFENVQNVSVTQGPLQRFLGIANLKVETAGGGQAQQGPHGEQAIGGHHGLIEGVADPYRIRDMILARLRDSTTAGLGDEESGEHVRRSRSAGWSGEHIAVLREIRDAVDRLAQPA